MSLSNSFLFPNAFSPNLPKRKNYSTMQVLVKHFIIGDTAPHACVGMTLDRFTPR